MIIKNNLACDICHEEFPKEGSFTVIKIGDDIYHQIYHEKCYKDSCELMRQRLNAMMFPCLPKVSPE